MVFPLPIEAVSLQSRTCPGKETDSLHQPCRNPARSLSALITERPVYHPDHPLGCHRRRISDGLGFDKLQRLLRASAVPTRRLPTQRARQVVKSGYNGPEAARKSGEGLLPAKATQGVQRVIEQHPPRRFVVPPHRQAHLKLKVEPLHTVVENSEADRRGKERVSGPFYPDGVVVLDERHSYASMLVVEVIDDKMVPGLTPHRVGKADTR